MNSGGGGGNGDSFPSPPTPPRGKDTKMNLIVHSLKAQSLFLFFCLENCKQIVKCSIPFPLLPLDCTRIYLCSAARSSALRTPTCVPCLYFYFSLSLHRSYTTTTCCWTIGCNRGSIDCSMKRTKITAFLKKEKTTPGKLTLWSICSLLSFCVIFWFV